MKVAVIGLGTMGMGAALNLVRKGHQVTGCEVREPARANSLRWAVPRWRSAADLPADTEAVVVFVVNAAQTEAVLFGDRKAAWRSWVRARSSCAAPPSRRRRRVRWRRGSRRPAS